MKRIVSLAITAIVATALLYISRFWVFDLWDRAGLFGLKALAPKGGLLAKWVRGTDLAPYELLIWAIGVFLILTVLQRAFDKIRSH